MVTFEYRGKIYTPSNLEQKLKKLGITLDDVKIIKDTKDNVRILIEAQPTYQQQNGIVLNVWKNKTNGMVAIVVNELDLSKDRGEDWVFIGSTLNPETKQIETVAETEERLGLYK